MNCKSQKQKTAPTLHQHCAAMLTVIFACLGGYLNAQTKSIKPIEVSGFVLDENKLALPGASVQQKNTTNGVVADDQGRFTLQVSDTSAILVVSFIGYKNQEVKVGATRQFIIVLKEDSQQLNEVVVIGYGTVDRRDATGAIVSVTAKELNKGNIVTPENLLQGRVAGVQINTGGEPGGGSSIRIRGGASLNASNDPLIVINGLPIDNNSVGGSRSILSTINPEDIESFTILKDASATAIYGSRAANGVIIITTKKGTKDLTISLNTTVSYNTLVNTTDVFSADEFRSLVADKYPTLQSRLGNANTDWQREIYNNTFSSILNLTIGANLFKTVPARFSMGRTLQNGLRLTSSFERNNATMSLNPSLFKNRLRISVNANYSYEKNRFAAGQEGNALTFDPTQPVYDPNSVFGGFFQYYTNNNDGIIDVNDLTPLAPRNPVAELLQRKSISDVHRLLGNVKLDYDLARVPGLSAALNLGIDRQDAFGSVAVSDQNPLAQADGRIVGSFSEYENSQVNVLLDAYANYKKTYDHINFDAVVGYSYQRFERERFNTNELLDNTDATKPILLIDPDLVLIGYFARTNIAFSNQYLFTFTYRRDGTSRFSPDNRWGNFPSAAFAWQLKETFFKRVEKLSTVKTRVSWGITGQQDIGSQNLDLYLDRYIRGIPNSQYQFGDNIIPIGLPVYRNEQLRWEQTTTYNVGVDVGILQDRFTASVDVFRKDSKDLLVFAAVADGSNFSNAGFQNIGNMVTQGVEFLVQGDVLPKSSRVQINSSFNATFFKRDLTQLFQNEDIITGSAAGGTGVEVQIHRVGYTPYSFFVFKQIYDSNGKPIEGAYADLNGDNIINGDDRYIHHNNDPTVSLGFASNITYKRFDLAFNLRAVLGNYVYNNINSSRAQYGLIQNNQVLANLPQSVQETNFYFTENVILSDLYVENASFLRMDNITLGYRFKSFYKNKLGLYVSVGVRNAFVLTRYSGIDPEVFNNGIDNTLYPRARTYLINTSFQF